MCKTYQFTQLVETFLMLLKMQGLRQSYDVVRTVNKSDCYK